MGKKKKSKARRNPKAKTVKPPSRIDSFKEHHPRIVSAGGVICKAVKVVETVLSIASVFGLLASAVVAAAGWAAAPDNGGVLGWLVSVTIVYVENLRACDLLCPFAVFLSVSFLVLVAFALFAAYGLANEPGMKNRTYFKSNGLPVFPLYVIVVQAIVLSGCTLPGGGLLALAFRGPVSFGIGAVLLFVGFTGLLSARIRLGGRWGISVNVIKGEEGLVTDGPYGIVRNPIYLATNVLYVGFAFMFGSLGILVVSAFAVALNCARALNEEEGLRAIYKKEWKRYAKKVPFMLPSVRRIAKQARRKRKKKTGRRNAMNR